MRATVYSRSNEPIEVGFRPAHTGKYGFEHPANISIGSTDLHLVLSIDEARAAYAGLGAAIAKADLADEKAA